MNQATPGSSYFVKLTKIIFSGKNATICDTLRCHRKIGLAENAPGELNHGVGA
jgi:hypothetical protein